LNYEGSLGDEYVKNKPEKMVKRTMR